MFKIKQLSLTSRARNNLNFWMFVGPLVIGVAIFIYIPIIWGLVLSFFEARNTVTPNEFIAFQNYESLFRDTRFIDSLEMIFGYSVVIVPLTFAVSLGLALLVNHLTVGRGIFRTVFFIPTAVSYVAASMVWKMSLFNGLPSGFMNNILWIIAEGDPIAWVNTADPPYFWIVLATVRIWLQSGFYMIILLAGLQNIPKSLYEAAYVDGAKPGWQTFRNITLPMLRNPAISVMILLFIEAFQAFDEFRNILGAGTALGTEILARPPLIYLYSVAFQDQNYGKGSAGAFVVALIILLVTVFQARIFGFGDSE